jgi:purine-nucleoside phosphorylase
MSLHIGAPEGAVAETVLMPGDPLRAKFIAETFLENAEQYNNIRGMLGFTGTYKGVRVSVQGSGMGIPSIGIYSYELYNFYNVQNIIRIGTAGSLAPALKIKDIVIGQSACTTSAFANTYGLPGVYAPPARYWRLEKAGACAKEKGVHYQVGSILSSDAFYGEDPDAMAKWRDMGVLAVEMEAAGLYMVAARAKKNALCITTVSDEIFTGNVTSPEERQTAFTDMMEIALNTVVRVAEP